MRAKAQDDTAQTEGAPQTQPQTQAQGAPRASAEATQAATPKQSVAESFSELSIRLKDDAETRLKGALELTWRLTEERAVATAGALNIWRDQRADQTPRWVVFYGREHLKLDGGDAALASQLSEALKSREPLKALRVGWIGEAPTAELIAPLLKAYRDRAPEHKATATLVGAHTLVKVDRALDDTVMWFSGLQPVNGTLPSKLTKSKTWKRHARIISKLWEGKMTPVLATMSEWIKDKIDTLDDRPVFYPFSGPDILNALTLYPNSRDYLMIALEKEGGVPKSPTKLDKETRKGLKILRDYIVGLVNRNFFITYEMRGKQKQAALGDNRYTGVGSVILFFLARTGHEIISMRKIKLGEGGEVIDADQKGNVNGVEIYFRTRSDVVPSPYPTRRVIFLRTNIADPYIKNQQGLIPLIMSYGQYNTIVKAASYLMHMSVFDDIRALILKRSLNIISDDTGVPYHFFLENEGELSIRLFGKYTRPNPGSKSFANRCQPDLREAIKRSGEPLPFKFGYYLAKPNLLLARRLKPIEEPVFDHSSKGVTTIYKGDAACTEGRQVIKGK